MNALKDKPVVVYMQPLCNGGLEGLHRITGVLRVWDAVNGILIVEENTSGKTKRNILNWRYVHRISEA